MKISATGMRRYVKARAHHVSSKAYTMTCVSFAYVRGNPTNSWDPFGMSDRRFGSTIVVRPDPFNEFLYWYFFGGSDYASWHAAVDEDGGGGLGPRVRTAPSATPIPTTLSPTALGPGGRRAKLDQFAQFWSRLANSSNNQKYYWSASVSSAAMIVALGGDLVPAGGALMLAGGTALGPAAIPAGGYLVVQGFAMSLYGGAWEWRLSGLDLLVGPLPPWARKVTPPVFIENGDARAGR